MQAPTCAYASRHAYQKFLDLGIEIHEYQPTMMHAKVMVADGSWSIFGSANFDNRSLELNDEMNVAVSDPGLAARLLQDFNRDLQRSNFAVAMHRLDEVKLNIQPQLLCRCFGMIRFRALLLHAAQNDHQSLAQLLVHTKPLAGPGDLRRAA